MKTIILIGIILIITSCKVVAPIASTDTTKTSRIEYINRDSIIYLSDSSGLRALLECDSLGQVRIKQIQNFYQGQFVKPAVKVEHNILRVDCKVDSAKIYLTWKERNEATTTNIHTLVVPPQTNILTGWQWFQIWLCRILLIIGVLVGLFYVVKNSTWWMLLLNWGTKLTLRLFNKG